MLPVRVLRGSVLGDQLGRQLHALLAARPSA